MEINRRHPLSITIALMAVFGIIVSTIPFLLAWRPNIGVDSPTTVKVDLQKLNPGERLFITWQHKPVWIIRRTQAMLDRLPRIHPLLRDPDSLIDQQPSYTQNEYRSLNPEYLIIVGLCTHLGCSPRYKPCLGELSAKWPGGFFCPCHGSTFDLAGRVMKGAPASKNLEVPPYRFIDAHTVVIGENPRLL